MKQNKKKNSFYMKDNLHVAGIHTALDILRFAVFFVPIFGLAIGIEQTQPSLSLCWG